MGETRRRRKEERKLQAVRGCIFRERMERLAVDFEKCTLPPDPISLSLSLSLFRESPPAVTQFP